MVRRALKFDPDEMPELTAEDLQKFRSLKEDMPEVVAAFKRGRGRPSLGDEAKTRISLRLPPKVIAAYRATGAGWQQRIGDVLAKHAPTRRGQAKTTVSGSGKPQAKQSQRTKRKNLFVPVQARGKAQHKQP
ncbi:MAG TPA: BrnA antitoxin family protein [Rhizomicrobium sp.]|jgi:uncharacterized protein (DUF4415 family)